MKKRGKSALLLAFALIAVVLIAACGGPQTGVNRPEQFAFEPVEDADPGEVVTSNVVTITGSTGPLEAGIAGGDAVLIINGEDAGEDPTVDPGDEIAVRMTASTVHEETVTATVTVGTVHANFSVTTRAPSDVPAQFEFTAATDVTPGQEVTSNTVTLAGFDDPTEATVTGGTLILNGADVTTTPVEVSAGDEIAVRVTAPNDYGETTTATVDVGGVSADFVVSTRSAPVAPTITDFGDDVNGEAGPGESITLTWTIDGDFDQLEISVEGAAAEDISGQESYSVTVPQNQPTVSYTLTATSSLLPDTATATHTVRIPLWVCNDNTYPITFENAELESALRSRVASIPSTGEIQCTQMQDASFTSFESGHHAGNVGTIDSLVGLQHATNLETLVLQYNEISDLAPIAGLTNLEVINFDRNRILDLSPLAELENLVEIGFWDNGPTFDTAEDGITDISVLANLPNLEVIYLSDNNIADITALEELDNMRVLWLIRNNLTNSSLSPLTGKTTLRSLRIGNQRINRGITDSTVLATLPNLAWLEIQYTGLTDLSFISSLTELYALGIDGLRVTDLDFLEANTAFPNMPVDVAELGVGAPSTPMLTLENNCLDTTPGGDTANYIAGLEGPPSSVDVEGFTEPEQQTCGTGPTSQAELDAFMLQLQQGIGYR